MAFVRLTQQILVVAYKTAQPIRVSALAIEVLRTPAGTAFVAPSHHTSNQSTVS